jgi:hypothetical protein
MDVEAALRVGDTLDGFVLQESKDTPRGHAFLFSHGNEAVMIEMNTNDYMDYMLSPYERARITDQLRSDLYEAFRDKKSRIWSR